VVVADGLTLTAVPLVAAMLPGVITPEPPLNVGNKLELAPASIVVGVAPKPFISGGPVISELAPPHPAKSKMATLTTTVNITEVTLRFMTASIYAAEFRVTDG
jgi:hypothetical protein